VEPDALKVLHTQTQGYPYFVQLMGWALWDALPPGADRITADVLKAALPVYEQQREAHYEERAGEIREAGLLRAAVELGNRMRRSARPKIDGLVMETSMQDALEAGLGEDVHAWETLAEGPALQSATEKASKMEVHLAAVRTGNAALDTPFLAGRAVLPALAYLSAKGFVWKPEAGGYRLGIPSLHDHLLASLQHALEPAPEAPPA